MAEGPSPVAVVITVKNDPRVVPCVEAILSQDPSFCFSTVVVDNGSTDQTPAHLEEAFGGDERVTLTSMEGNLSKAWNKAAQSADAGILVRIDADARPEPGWLEALVEPLRSGEVGWTAGPVQGVRNESLVERYFHHRTETYCKRLEDDPELQAGVPSWNVAYTRDALDRAGWYDPWQASSVDWDLHKRIVDAGIQGRFAPKAGIRHHHPASVRTFARKEAWYRTGHYQMMLKYGPGAVASTFLLPGAYALVVLLGTGAFLVPWLGAISVGLLVALLLKHAQGGLFEGDPMWWARLLFRPIEAFAGMYGLARGLARYGVKPRPVPDPGARARAKEARGSVEDGAVEPAPDGGKEA